MSTNPNDRRYFERSPTLNSGELDRRVTIERKRVSRDPNFGAESITWSMFAERWAKVRDVNAFERVAGPLRTLTRVTTVTIRWTDGITSDMRVKLEDGRLLQIASVAQIGNKLGLQLVCEEYSA
jgi:SPP1 family predicted phage head-tail adaptor